MEPKARLFGNSWIALAASFAVVAGLALLPGRAGAQSTTGLLPMSTPNTFEMWFSHNFSQSSYTFGDAFVFSVPSTFNFSFTDFVNNNAGSPGAFNISPLTAYLFSYPSAILVPGAGSTASGPSLLNTNQTLNLPAGSYSIVVSGTTGSGGGSYWGAITVTTNTVSVPIPEPETYAMMLAGLGLMGFVARRRKQKEAAGA